MKDIKIHNPQVQDVTYGTYKPLMFTVIDKQHPKYSRIDEYNSKSSGDKVNEIVWTDGTLNDLTPIFTGKYNADCYGCYTGKAHTNNFHNSKI